MQKFLQTFILASSVLIFSTSLALTLSQTSKPKEAAAVYQDEKGNLKYAQGSCQKDSDCFVGGCSSEYCTNQQDLVSICIYSADFPNKDVFSCGCWQESCAWIKR